MKQCGSCKETKKLTEFHKSARIGLQYNCKQCSNKINMKWKKENPGSHLMSKYGISREKKQEMISKQNDSCAICKEKFTSGKYTNVDHCHTTKKIRGILCRNCNTALGSFKDSPKLLQRAIHYIEYYAKQNTATPIPTGTNIQGEDGKEPRTIPATRPGEDGDDTDHHCGADARKDADYCPQESRGDSMGHGGNQMGTPQAPESSQGNGDTDTKTSRVTFPSRHLFN